MGKRKKVKGSQKKISALCFFKQDTSTLCRCVQNLKTLALLAAEKSVTKIIGEKEKNKGNDKHEDADSL